MERMMWKRLAEIGEELLRIWRGSREEAAGTGAHREGRGMGRRCYGLVTVEGHSPSNVQLLVEFEAPEEAAGQGRSALKSEHEWRENGEDVVEAARGNWRGSGGDMEDRDRTGTHRGGVGAGQGHAMLRASDSRRSKVQSTFECCLR